MDIFENLSSQEKENILINLEAHITSYKKEVNILSIIEDDLICIVQDGYVQVITTDFNGNQIILEKLHKNDIFSNIFTNINSSQCTIQTKKDSTLITFEIENIYKLDINLPGYQIFLNNFLKMLSEKSKQLNKRIEISSKRSIRDKLLEYFAFNEKRNITILETNYSDLANYLGVDRSAMMREIKNLCNDNIIKKEGRKITRLT